MKCPIHLNTNMVMTDWKPPPGMKNPELRQFECPVCRRRRYKKPDPKPKKTPGIKINNTKEDK